MSQWVWEYVSERASECEQVKVSESDWLTEFAVSMIICPPLLYEANQATVNKCFIFLVPNVGGTVSYLQCRYDEYNETKLCQVLPLVYFSRWKLFPPFEPVLLWESSSHHVCNSDQQWKVKTSIIQLLKHWIQFTCRNIYFTVLNKCIWDILRGFEGKRKIN